MDEYEKNVTQRQELSRSYHCYKPFLFPATFQQINPVFQINIYICCYTFGAVAFLLSQYHGKWHSCFVMARSNVAPKKQLSMPRLELCGSSTTSKGADLEPQTPYELMQPQFLSFSLLMLWGTKNKLRVFFFSHEFQSNVSVYSINYQSSYMNK